MAGVAQRFIALTVSIRDRTKGALRGIRNRVNRFARGAQSAARRVVPGFSRVEGAVRNLRFRFKGMQHMAEGFRMEFLSLMFAGMALNRVFKRLLNLMPGMEAATSAVGSALRVVMIPLSDVIVPMLLKMSNVLMNLPRPVKQAIGVLTVFGVVLGTLLTVGGMLALTINSIILGAAPLAVALAGLSAAATAVILNWQTLANIGRTLMDIIGGFVGTLVDAVKEGRGVVGGLQDAFSITVDRIRDEVLPRIQPMLSTALDAAINGVMSVITGLSGVVTRGFSTLMGALDAAAVVGALVDMLESGFQAVGLGGLWDKIESGISAVADFFNIIFSGIKAITNGQWDRIASVLSKNLTRAFGRSFGGDGGGGILGNFMMGAFGAPPSFLTDIIDVNDFVITDGGKIIKANPNDTLIGTKNPGALGRRGGGPITINVDAELRDEMDVDTLVDRIETRIDRNISGRGITR